MLACLDADGLTDHGTKGSTSLIEEVRRLGHGSRTFHEHLFRMLVAAAGTGPAALK